MLIDCDACRVRGPACGDCVVTVLLGAPPDGVRLDREERHALDVLAASGLVPPLRLVVLGPPPAEDGAEDQSEIAVGDVRAQHHDRIRGSSEHRRHVG